MNRGNIRQSLVSPSSSTSISTVSYLMMVMALLITFLGLPETISAQPPAVSSSIPDAATSSEESWFVKFETDICIIAPEQKHRFGIDWHTTKGDGQSPNNSSGLPFSELTSKYGLQNTSSDYRSLLSHLHQDGYLTRKASPVVVAESGTEASVSIMETKTETNQFYLLPATLLDICGYTQTVEERFTVKMTPIVRGDMISVQVEQTEEGEDVRTNPLLLELEANPYPVINRRTVSTTVDVKDGEVFVMGGLVQRQAGDSFISVLGIFDIPLPENLVRLVEKQAQDAEVAIVITPSIVRE